MKREVGDLVKNLLLSNFIVHAHTRSITWDDELRWLLTRAIERLFFVFETRDEATNKEKM